MLTSKVFSAQYLIWIMPLIALVDGLDVPWILVALLTTVIFPILFDRDVAVETGSRLSYGWPLLAAAAVRNALLLLVTLREVGVVRWGPSPLRWLRPIESSPVPR